VTRLRALAHAAGGWIVFDDEHEETLVSFTEWEARFARWCAGGGRTR